MIQYLCKNCGKEIQTYPSIKRSFCSRFCKADWQSKNIRGTKHYNFVNRIQISCQTCNKPLFVTPYYVGIKNYCSRECKHIGQSKIMSGKNNPFWKGGIGQKYRQWGSEFNRRLKRKVKERDCFTCQKCKSNIKSSDHKFVVHHVDFNPRNNLLKNLQLLCHPCHMSMHK